METEENLRNDEKDILDSSIFGVNAKLLECALCYQKFTNKVCDPNTLKRFDRIHF